MEKKNKQAFYKTGPLFYKPGAMSPINNAGAYESAGGSNDSQSDAEAMAAQYGRKTDLSMLDSNDTSATTNTVESATTESNKLLGRNIAKGKGSGKLNRARRKLDKATMQSEGKSRLEVRQAKTKSKIAETKTKLSELGDSPNQGKRERLASRLKFQIARDKRMTGRKAKREAIKNYGK